MWTAFLSMTLLWAGSARADEWRLDPSTGSFRVIIRRDGPLQLLGHDHVLDAKDFRGTVEILDSSATLHLEVNAAGVEVDEPSTRRAEGFKGEVSESDRVKIRRTMRSEKVLDVRRYPMIKLDARSIEPVAGETGLWMLSGEFFLHGSTATLELPVTLTPRPGGYWVSGYVRIHPSDYGIKPVKAAGGLVSTADEALVRFNIGLVH